MQTSKKLGAFALIPVGALVLAGCAPTTASDDAADDATITIVASTDVTASVAQAVAGDDVEVVAIIEGAAQDPHSYEATARDQLTISEADIVIENGGGYDPFIDTLVEASGSDATVLNASELSGLMPGEEGAEHSHAEEDHAHEGEEAEAEHDHAEEEHADEEGEEHAHEEEGHEGHDHIEGFNEHVWYSFSAMDALAHELVHVLGDLDPDAAEALHENYDAFAAELTALEERATGLQAAAAGRGVVVTEPVPLYLLESVGLVNRSPEDFTEAIEEGSDVSPASLNATLTVIAGGGIGLLAYNEQTTSNETEQVREAAESAGIPVVDFTETLPEGDDYVSWMTANLTAIEEALGA